MWTWLLSLTMAVPAAPHAATFQGEPQGKALLTLLAVERHGGKAPATAATHYTFVVNRDGLWEYHPTRGGQLRKGVVPQEELKRWLKELEDHGLFRQTGNEKLGEHQEPYLLAVLTKNGLRHRVKLPLEYPLCGKVDRKILEIVKPMGP